MKSTQHENLTPAPPENPDEKMQKKVYLTPIAASYLSRMQTESGKSQGEIVEALIEQEYRAYQERKQRQRAH